MAVNACLNDDAQPRHSPDSYKGSRTDNFEGHPMPSNMMSHPANMMYCIHQRNHNGPWPLF
jgi:hypothetical protein